MNGGHLNTGTLRLKRPASLNVSSSLCRRSTSGGDAAAALGVGVRLHLEPALRQIQDAARSPDDRGAVVSDEQIPRLIRL